MHEALAGLESEITRCMRYYESTFPTQHIARVVFLGGQALDHRLCQALAQRLHLPAQVGDPFARIARPGETDFGLDRRQAQPAWAVAVGLSLGGQTMLAA
jgi:Tfp pilus assembly PilM family ATPase